MKQAHFFSTLLFCIFAFLATSLNAELIDRGGGLIYDTEQDLTWTQDAGLSGSRSWDSAMIWAENLEFGGFDDWRLPTTTQHDDDPTCSGDIRVSVNPLYPLIYEHRLDCLGGEMERLTAAADPWNNDLFKYIDAEGKVKRYVNRTRYWTATHYRDGTDPCIYYPDYHDVPCTITTQEDGHVNFRWQWAFTGAGDIEVPYKTTLKKGNGRYAWAVRDGDVAVAFLAGDVNLDGQVNLADYLLLTQFVLGTGSTPTTDQFNAGNMNQNSQLDAGDLVILSRTILGLI